MENITKELINLAEVKWIKLATDMFEDEKIDFIQSLPEGDAILVIWVRLLTMAGKCNAGGYIFLTTDIPYTDEMLANRFKKPLNIVKLALETFRRLKMLEFNDNGIFVSNFSKHQNIEGLEKIKEREKAKLRKRKQREKQKLIESPTKDEILSDVTGMSRDIHSDFTRDPSLSIYKDREIDKEEDIDKEDRKIDKETNLDKINQAYFNTFYRQISGTYLQAILKILDKGDYTELIIYAMKVTKQREKEQDKIKGFKYTMAILESWVNKGYKVPGDVQKNEIKKVVGNYKEFDLGDDLL